MWLEKAMTEDLPWEPSWFLFTKLVTEIYKNIFIGTATVYFQVLCSTHRHTLLSPHQDSLFLGIVVLKRKSSTNDLTAPWLLVME